VLRRILFFFLGIYLVVSLMYFGHKIFPSLEEYINKMGLSGKAKEEVQSSKYHQKVSFGNCEKFSFGHIAADEFRIFTRMDRDKENVVIDEQDLKGSIANKTCDRYGTLALILYDSQPVSVASVTNYDYSKPLAENSEEKPILYTVLKTENRIGDYPDSGFVMALYGFDRSNIEQYKTNISPVTKADEDLINGHNDTIFYENTKKDVHGVGVEYETIKTDLNGDGHDDLAVLSTWTDKALPQGVIYITVYVLSDITGSNLTRYDILPFTKVRKSRFFLFQLVDLNNDGRKEIIIRKNREGSDSFMIYEFDKSTGKYYLAP
jgi:hypothetical protein